MRIYKELIFEGDKSVLDHLNSSIYEVFPKTWITPKDSYLLKDYIVADYVGNAVPRAEVSIYYGSDTWRKGSVKVGNIVPLEKDQLTIEEYNEILELFYTDIVIPYCKKYPELNVEGPTSDVFEPLNYISKEALDKLTRFCNAANKSTGSAHPSDKQRWFDFICQTVDDNRIFSYDTLYEFLKDEDYWGKKDDGFLGVMGSFAWSEEKASELALEYENYVRILQYYKNTRKLEAK